MHSWLYNLFSSSLADSIKGSLSGQVSSSKQCACPFRSISPISLIFCLRIINFGIKINIKRKSLLISYHLVQVQPFKSDKSKKKIQVGSLQSPSSSSISSSFIIFFVLLLFFLKTKIKRRSSGCIVYCSPKKNRSDHQRTALPCC